MKRLLLIVSLLLVSAMLLVSCNADPHEHSFGEEWASDADYHWHACTVEGCAEQAGKAAHEFVVETDEEGKPYNVCTVCGTTNTNVSTAPEHEHVFAEEYSSNDNMHWYACTVENCYETKDKVEHAYGNPETEYADGTLTIKNVCVECGYEKVETQKVDVTVEDAVEWDNIFKGFKLTNFSMKVFFAGDGDSIAHVNECIITEDAVYYCIPNSREFYVKKNADGTYEGYLKNQETDKYEKMTEDLEAFFKGASTEPVLNVSFEENFDKFTYDATTGIYTSNEIIEAQAYNFNGTSAMDIFCHVSKVSVIDGKISYIECEYSFGSEDNTRNNFIYYNIGISNLEIPQAVKDEAK